MDEWQATKTTQKLKMATMFKSIMDKKKKMIFVFLFSEKMLAFLIYIVAVHQVHSACVLVSRSAKLSSLLHSNVTYVIICCKNFAWAEKCIF